jgi:hypothetical protein
MLIDREHIVVVIDPKPTRNETRNRNDMIELELTARIGRGVAAGYHRPASSKLLFRPYLKDPVLRNRHASGRKVIRLQAELFENKRKFIQLNKIFPLGGIKNSPNIRLGCVNTVVERAFLNAGLPAIPVVFHPLDAVPYRKSHTRLCKCSGSGCDHSHCDDEFEYLVFHNCPMMPKAGDIGSHNVASGSNDQANGNNVRMSGKHTGNPIWEWRAAGTKVAGCLTRLF